LFIGAAYPDRYANIDIPNMRAAAMALQCNAEQHWLFKYSAEVIMRTIYRALLGAAASLTAGSAQARGFPEVVPSLDLQRYLGTWYEVASTKPFFQRNCVCVTAKYSKRDDGKVDVVNSCRKRTVTGPLQTVEGVATPSRDPAKFSVSFGRFSFPITNYWVVDLADDYSYAVVSTPFRRPIWILSRTPEMAPATLESILARLKDAGFPTRAITQTAQEGCPS
jgi:apolipoprotein D and lipocalin family protein